MGAVGFGALSDAQALFHLQITYWKREKS